MKCCCVTLNLFGYSKTYWIYKKYLVVLRVSNCSLTDIIYLLDTLVQHNHFHLSFNLCIITVENTVLLRELCLVYLSSF